MRMKALICVLWMLLLAFDASAQSPVKKPTAWESADFDDVHLTLGMSKKEALARLTASDKVRSVKTKLPADEYSIVTKPDKGNGEYLGSVTFLGDTVDRIEEQEGGTLLFLPRDTSLNGEPDAQAIVAFKALYNAVNDLETPRCYLSTGSNAEPEQSHVMVIARCGREDIKVVLTTFEDGAKGVSVVRYLTRR